MMAVTGHAECKSQKESERSGCLYVWEHVCMNKCVPSLLSVCVCMCVNSSPGQESVRPSRLERRGGEGGWVTV